MSSIKVIDVSVNLNVTLLPKWWTQYILEF